MQYKRRGVTRKKKIAAEIMDGQEWLRFGRFSGRIASRRIAHNLFQQSKVSKLAPFGAREREEEGEAEEGFLDTKSVLKKSYPKDSSPQ
ncbi:hypothetical protein QE152_g29279 [Popillia japonica]|uniref:Uncharacterized protein n=1 Tax=Popillia japonica TaxID=7064 RepID=A0AAW1JHE2_POPJA